MKNQYSVFVVALVFALAACGGEKKETGGQKTDSVLEQEVNVGVTEPKVALPFDTLLTDYSNLIAGKPTLQYLKEVQAADYYEEHKAFTDTSWKRTTDSMLLPISTWIRNQKITDTSDNGLCFYPLSGPDFLFGNAFFPTPLIM